MTKIPTIRPDRGSPKIHPPKRKEKTKTPAPGDLSSKIIIKNQIKTLINASKGNPGGYMAPL
jgi:hypothetical protein